jgi:hypothetical protein
MRYERIRSLPASLIAAAPPSKRNETNKVVPIAINATKK